MTTDSLKATAYHESGHAVVAHWLGQRSRLVTIDPAKCSDLVGGHNIPWDGRVRTESGAGGRLTTRNPAHGLSNLARWGALS